MFWAKVASALEGLSEFLVSNVLSGSKFIEGFFRNTFHTGMIMPMKTNSIVSQSGNLQEKKYYFFIFLMWKELHAVML